MMEIEIASLSIMLGAAIPHAVDIAFGPHTTTEQAFFGYCREYIVILWAPFKNAMSIYPSGFDGHRINSK
jgi:hypothetical protein